MLRIKLSPKIILYILFLYQSYHLFQDYVDYKYSIELDFDVISRTLPSITVCIDKRYDLLNTDEWKNWKNPYGNLTIACFYNEDLSNILVECNEEKVYLRYRHKEICLTFFNNKTDNYYRVQYYGMDIVLCSLMFTQQKVIIHPPDTLSHFEINNIFVSNGYRYNNYIVERVTRFTLQKPYSTDCYEYSQNLELSLSPRSQSYCIFEYMRKEELNKCGKNIYWNQYVIDYKDQMNHLKFKNESSNECFAKFNNKLLSKLCKIDCISDKYTVSES